MQQQQTDNLTALQLQEELEKERIKTEAYLKKLEKEQQANKERIRDLRFYAKEIRYVIGLIKSNIQQNLLETTCS